MTAEDYCLSEGKKTRSAKVQVHKKWSTDFRLDSNTTEGRIGEISAVGRGRAGQTTTNSTAITTLQG
jgi:hypothetical protein